MKTKNLQECIKRLKKVYSGGNSLPILDNIHFDNGMAVVTNLELWIRVPVSIKGNFLIRFKDLERAMKGIKTDEVEIVFSEDGKKVLVKAVGKERKFTFPSDDVQEYVTTPIAAQPGGKLTAIDLDLISRTIKFAGNDDLRSVMSGVLIGEQIVSTNAHHLVWHDIEGETTEPIIICKLKAIMVNGWESCEIYLGKNEASEAYFTYARFLNPDTGEELIGRLTQGKFPNYKSVIPRMDAQLHKAVIDKKELLETISGALICANQTNFQARFEINNAEQLTVSSEDIDLEREFEELLPGTYESEENLFVDSTFGVNLKFLKMVVRDIDKEKITINWQAGNRAILIEDNYLIMPVMLNN